MEEIYNMVSSPDWWFNAVFIAVLASIIAAYWVRLIDSFIPRFSSRWQRRTEKKKKEFEALVQKLRSDPTEQIFAASAELGYKVMSSVYGATSFICLSMFLGNIILRRISEEAFKNSLSSLDLIGPVVSSAPSKLGEYPFLLLVVFFQFLQVHYSNRGFRLGTAITEARKSQTPNKEQDDTTTLRAAD